MKLYTLTGNAEQHNTLRKFLRRCPVQGIEEARALLALDNWLNSVKQIEPSKITDLKVAEPEKAEAANTENTKE